jgi:AmpE protein
VATALLAVVIAVVVGHAAPDLARLRQFGWFAEWIRAARGWFGQQAFWSSSTGAAVVIALPVFVMVLLQGALDDRAFGLAELALGVVVLYWCWGPRDLDLDVDAIASAPDSERRQAAVAALAQDPLNAPAGITGAALVDAVFRASLVRWFGVLFWFVLLGPAGALLYRLVQLSARNPAFTAELPAPQVEALEPLARLLDWPAAQLMTLALAIAADFDAVAAAWRDYHAARGHWFALDEGFLLAAGRASVAADADGGDAYQGEGTAPVAEMQEAMSLVWRILVVWGVVFALFVLAGKIS